MTDRRPARIAVVGSGWRAEHFFRIIKELPDQFELVGIAVRREAEAARLVDKGIHAVTELAQLADLEPDFVVVATPAEMNAEVCEKLAAHGHSILLETPPGVSDHELDRMFELERSGAVIQVAEQYPFQPLLAARLWVISSGRLGAVSSADISVAHGYHGVALLRAALSVGLDEFEVTAHEHRSQITIGPNRTGPPTRDGVEASVRTVATIKFGNRVGLFDWADGQYFSWIRSLRFVVRGIRGELNGHEVRYLLEDGTPVRQVLRRVDTGLEGNLEGLGHVGYLLGDEWVYRNPFPKAKLTDDEIAIATVMQRMVEYLAGGPPVYSLEQAAQDTRISLAIARTASS